MNYIYKDKLYTIRKIDIKDFTQFEGKWYPTVFYENEEGLRFNRSVKEFFDKFELYRVGFALPTCPQVDIAKDIAKGIDNHLVKKAKDSEFNWIARDKDDGLFIYKHKPTLQDNDKFDGDGSSLVKIDQDSHKEVTFENSPQPWPLKKEPQDLIALVLEKMPFLDSEEFAFIINNIRSYDEENDTNSISVIKRSEPNFSYCITKEDLETRGIRNEVKSFFNLD